LKFINAPAAGQRGSARTMLGGTGVAVSRASPYREHAVAYAKWLVSKEHQGGTYFREGGQPASLAAWTDPEVNAASSDFFRDTLLTLESAYVRPRFDGFVRFFESAAREINRCLRGQGTDEQLIGWLNDHYAASRSGLPQARQRSTA
jgi:multiple sugar transport system substrate-binding protein